MARMAQCYLQQMMGGFRQEDSPLTLRNPGTVKPGDPKTKGVGPKPMKLAERLVWIGIGLAGVFWILESAIHVFIFHEGGLIQQISSPAAHEIWMRLIVVSMFIAFAIYAQFIIIQRMRAEAELNQIFQTAADGMRVIDKDFNVLRVNDTFTKVSGVNSDKAIGRKCYEVFRGPVCHTAQCPLNTILAGEERVEYDAEKERNDGKTVPCIVTATAFRRPDGSLIGIVEDFKDITERIQSEVALRESEERYRSLFEDSRDAIYITAQDGEFIDVNQSALDLFGYARQEIVGLNAREMYVDPDERPLFQHEIEQKGSVRDYELKFRKKDGTPMDCLVTASVRRASDGSLLGYQGIIRDITESKRLEARLQQAQKMEAIGTLAGGIAHDFNNLLMGIQGNISLILVNMESADPNYDRVQDIAHQIQSGATLTSRLLGYARKGKYEVKAVSLNQLLEETSDTFGRTRRDIGVHLELAQDLSAVEADPEQIEQVLWNLYINAADAMPDGGNLILKTANTTHKDMKDKLYEPKAGNYVLLTVTDTGTGMDKDAMERVYDPFFTTKEMGRGTGLGLASAYGIIKGHGGYIDVDSKKGHGTTFSICLPASEKRVPEAVRHAEQFIKGSETVLLVDDEESIRRVGKDLLEAMGYQVLLATGGKEAIDVYQQHRDDIDIVLLDMIMPRMRGGETYDRIKELNPDVKVLLSSGYSIDGAASEILERGCDGFIQKPFNMQQLSAKLREILDRQ